MSKIRKKYAQAAVKTVKTTAKFAEVENPEFVEKLIEACSKMDSETVLYIMQGLAYLLDSKDLTKFLKENIAICESKELCESYEKGDISHEEALKGALEAMVDSAKRIFDNE